MGKILYIVNPGAAGGQGEVAWNRFREAWSDAIDPEDVRFTEGPGDAGKIAASVVGYDVLAAVGGDGNVNEILNGILGREKPHPCLAIIPAGTGNDIARTIGVYPLEAAVNALNCGQKRAFDLIRIDGHGNGREFTRYAFLSGGIGFSAAAITRPWAKRFLGATLAYYWSMFLAILAHRPPNMTVRWGDNSYEGRTWMVVTANVESVSGGSMRIAPGASPHDGMISVTIVEARPKLTMIFKGLPKVASGKHIQQEGFHYFQTPKIEITSDVLAVMDPDGEVEWATHTLQTIVPGAVKILAPELKQV